MHFGLTLAKSKQCRKHFFRLKYCAKLQRLPNDNFWHFNQLFVCNIIRMLYSEIRGVPSFMLRNHFLIIIVDLSRHFQFIPHLLLDRQVNNDAHNPAHHESTTKNILQVDFKDTIENTRSGTSSDTLSVKVLLLFH